MAANKTFFGRLQTLFSTGTVVRRTDDGLKVTDINKVQSNTKLATNRVIDRFNRLYQSTQQTGYNQQANFHTMRTQLYTDYEIMDEDSIISAALDIYADESTLKNELGDVLKINSDNEEIEKVLNNLFYDVLNIEFNAWPWIRNLCKYGDFYLKLDITEKVGITNAIPLSSYEMFREEGQDPQNPELVKFVHDESMAGHTGAGMKTTTSLENYEVAHFRLLNDMNFLPYGKSMVEPARKTWKQLTLMEDAMMIHRIMRAPEKRIYKIDIGNIPPNEVDAYMQKVMQSMKKTPYLDPNTGQYNLKFNMQNMMEDVYLPVRGGQSGTEIESLSGMDFGGIDDIEYLKNRMFAALKIPKAFMGYEEDLNAKSTLAAQDIRFARTIERIQRIFVSELTKIAMVHLYAQGFEDKDMLDFELELAPASTIAEQEKIELWSTKVDLASSMKDLEMMSQDWIYENLFNLNEDDMKKEKASVISDTKQLFRRSQIGVEGNDPMETGEALGTPHTLATIDPQLNNPEGTSIFDAGDDADYTGTGELPEPPEAKPAPQGFPKAKVKESKNRSSQSKNERTDMMKSMFALKKKIGNSSLLNESNILDDNL
mgnify:FL=1|tara:strand:+ start:582 stop:2375 length:1794 start_codon:yes stop_codon:yes gene_type:complete